MQKGAIVGWILVVVVILITIGAGIYYLNNKPNLSSVVTNFEECKAAEGSKLLTSYPAVCVTKDGQRFTENVQIMPVVTANPTATSSAQTTNWGIYTIGQLNLQFQLPPNLATKFGGLKVRVIPGQTGTLLSGSFANPSEERFTLGTTSIDYSQGRGGAFTDLQGFINQEGKCTAKFVGQSPIELGANDCKIVRKDQGLDYLLVKSNLTPDDGPTVMNTLGSGNIGALVNLKGSTYTGLAIIFKPTKDLDEKAFDRIMSTFLQTK